MNLYSYVVRYDSGFAPNPFYGFCSLSTCKPHIRKNAEVGDWIIGSGSANKKVGQGGRLVYAMKVTETLTFEEYFEDSRFYPKKPILTGSKKQARGDNIYYQKNNQWCQLDSFHSHQDGTKNTDHIKRDTGINRVLISEHYKYFGKNGPSIPTHLISRNKTLCHKGIGQSKFSDKNTSDKRIINQLLAWLENQGEKGFNTPPTDWKDIPCL